jgi:pilus assembly protein Flp/PilA
VFERIVQPSDHGKPWPLVEQNGVGLMTVIKRFAKCESGATAIEYGLIAAGIAVVVIGAVQATGKSLKGTFNTIKGAL